MTNRLYREPMRIYIRPEKRARPCVFKPLHVWTRHHPLAHRIAARILKYPGVLCLRPRTLVKDICWRYRCCVAVAFEALRIARAA